MSDQNITELPVKTSSGITSSDYMLGIDSAEGYQMLIRDLGDYIIRNVQVNTIAGSNQTLKSALDTLNSNSYLLKGGTRLASNQSNPIDANDLGPGNYYIQNNSEANYISNIPFKRAGRLTVFSSDGVSSTNYLRQEYIAYDGDPYVRIRAGSTWSDWVKQPTRAEMTPTEITDFVTIDTSKATLINSSCYKVGNVVFIAIDFTVVTSDSSPIIGTLASSIRPPKKFYYGCFDYTDKSKSKTVGFFTNGSIFVYAPENGHEYFLSCTYITT